MAKTLVEKWTSASDENMRLFQQDRAILEVTELIWELMEEQGMSKADLAAKLDTSRSYITQLLDGRANMTIRKITDVLFHLGRTLHFADGPIALQEDGWQEWREELSVRTKRYSIRSIKMDEHQALTTQREESAA